MAIAAAGSDLALPWWKEPTKDQWLAMVAAWLGWLLDGFDFTIFLLLLLPIANEFEVSVTAVAAVLTFTLWLRLVGAVGAGWLADRIGRKTPLMISIVWFSVCNFIAGFSPSYVFLFAVRAVLGIGMGAEWPLGQVLPWNHGRRGHADSWAPFCRAVGVSGSCSQAWPTRCSLTLLAGGAFYGSAFCRPLSFAPTFIIS